MIKRVLGSRLPLIVYNPPKVFDIEYFKSAWEAGGLPVLDTEFFDHDTIIKQIGKLARQPFPFGVRLFVHQTPVIDYIKETMIPNLDLVVFGYHRPEELEGFEFDSADYTFFMETVHTELAGAMDRIAPHGLIIKGCEAPGKVSRFTSFVLMQWWLENSTLPVFVHGGVGRRTGAGMFAAGCCGVVLDDQLYLCDEAPLSDDYKGLMEKLEDGDSVVVGDSLDVHYRFFAKLGTAVVKKLKETESQLSGKTDAGRLLYEEVVSEIAAMDESESAPVQRLLYLGQDAVFAKGFVRESRKIREVVEGFFLYIGEMLRDVDDHDPMIPKSKLARAHGTRLPVMQGPMANISDNGEFARAVLDNGGLPFFAMGSLPADLAETMLSEGSRKVDRFGAGLIGIETFNATIDAHMELVKKYKAPFALFAGGIPGQVKELEAAGVKAYLHTPSIRMLRNAIDNGCTRFIFEGTEAGGHVGSLTSLVLWEMAMDVFLNQPDEVLETMSIVFAGGIGSPSASHFISGVASVLARRGAAVGIQVGTNYLFTKEIVETCALRELYQEVILKAKKTMVIGNTVGLASRTVGTPFSKRMLETEYRLIKEGEPLGRRKTTFENDNIGSLLIGAKAFHPDFSNPDEVRLVHHDEKSQYENGNFLVGDCLAFNDRVTTVADVHDFYFNRKKRLADNLNRVEAFSSPTRQLNDEIAIIGMSCIYPGASTPEALWENILARKYAIRELPADRLNQDFYYDPDRKAEDKTYSRIAGVVEDFMFDHDKYGYTPEKAEKLSRSQKMMLEAAYMAAEDAGCLDENGRIEAGLAAATAVIAASCLGNELASDLHQKYHYPEVRFHLDRVEAFTSLPDEQQEILLQALKQGLAGTNTGYEPVHGAVLNMEAGRIAHHMGATGPNFAVDAACATSFTAIDIAVRELLAGTCDMVIAGGVNTNLAPETFVGFSKMGALSNDGSLPFDERANGFVLGEGAGVFVLKRVRDAVRDGDRIHAVIKAVGASSDGKGKAIAAPNAKGQALALARCYEKIKTGTRPAEIGFIEAHGTSTTMGDATEIETLKSFYGDASAGISSIKSQIGHLLGGSGAAGLTKAVLALEHKTLPPNGGFQTLSPKCDLSGSDLFIVTEAGEWKVEDGRTRKAAVSSYGFGGINYHVVVEEHSEAYQSLPREIFSDPSHDFNGDRIVAVGLGVVLPGAKNADEFWSALEKGDGRLTAMPDSRFHNAYYAMEPEDSHYHLPMVKAGVVEDFAFNNAKYRIPPLAARSVDRAQLFALDAASQAVDQAGLLPRLTRGNKTAVILGTLPGTRQVENILRVRLPLIREIIDSVAGPGENAKRTVGEALEKRIRERYPKNTEDTIPGLLSNIVSGRIANYFGCNGANFVVDASCASGAAAIDQAMKGLRSGDHDFVITGGVDANLYPGVMLAFKRLGLLSPGECRFFDKTASGYVMGEGAAVQILTTYKNARKHGMPVLGEINGFYMESSAPAHLLAPNQAVYASAMDGLYERIGVNKRQVAHLDVFGVSNLLLDSVEKQAVEASFRHPTFFGNIKPEFGYFKAANPAVVLAKLMLMIRNGTILPNRSHSETDSIVGKDSVLRANDAPLDASRRRVFHLASNVNGIGGNHGHMVVGAAPPWMDERAMEKHAAETIRMKKRETKPVEMETAQPAATPPRRAVELPAAPAPAIAAGGVLALLSGQGAQRRGMMKELYDAMEDVRTMMDRGDRIFREARGYSLLDIMFNDAERLNLTANTQPAVFLSSAVLYERLSARGFAPDRFIGHSVGEYTALFCAGILPFDEAMALVIRRADFMHDATKETPGRILVVFKNAAEAGELIRASGLTGLWTANKNSEKQTAISGGKAEIERFVAWLKAEKTLFKKLPLSGAFHTPLFRSAADRMADHLSGVSFRRADYTRIISNVTGEPYPQDEAAVKDLLARQIVSPVEFISSVQNARAAGMTRMVEIGPGALLINLLKNITMEGYIAISAIDARLGEIRSLERLDAFMEKEKRVAAMVAPQPVVPAAGTAPEEEIPITSLKVEAPSLTEGGNGDAAAFDEFLRENDASLKKLMYREYLRHKKEKAVRAAEKFNFHGGKIAIAGVSAGLPGTGNKVFNADNFDKILAGFSFIEPLDQREKERIVDMNITRVFKNPDGAARFVEINSTEDVIQLAGKLGYFDPRKEYGLDFDYDITISLAIAAGLEALKDARIPLVMSHRTTSTGRLIPDGFALPEEMRDDTGVIMTSLFPGFETLIEALNRYYYNKFYVKPYDELENIYYHLMEVVRDNTIKGQLTDWFFRIKERRKVYGTFKFDRNILFDLIPLGSAHFAQLLKVRGPNIQMSGACASTTQAVAVAEDWIRTGRCDRVIIIGGEAATSETQNPWIGSGFLALGAATVKNVVSEAAKPFDAKRDGTILGSGAVSMIVEREDRLRERGLNGQAEVLGTYMGNSAFHATRIDVNHLSSEMNKFMRGVETRHDLNKEDYTSSMLFMSHETFTPARGGSAAAEVSALRSTFPDHYRRITITNTKGFTGHTLGAAIEDAVLVKALQKGLAPPIANLTDVPEEFDDLRFSRSGGGDYRYGLHYSAGFGSHFSFLFMRRIQERDIRDNAAYAAWLRRISGMDAPELTTRHNTLIIKPEMDGKSAPGVVDAPAPAAPHGPAIPAPAPQPAAPSEKALAAPAPAREADAPDAGALLKTVQAIIAEETGYTLDMLEPELDLEADLGIDTVKQVEIFGKITANFNLETPEDLQLRDLNTIARLAAYIEDKTGAAPGAGAGDSEAGSDISGESRLADVQAIIAEETGYTLDMLEPELDLEADLGIDTVKQVEIFGKITANFDLETPEDLQLRDLNTIARLAAYIEDKTGAAPAAGAGESEAGSEVSGESRLADVQAIIAEETGYTLDMLEPELDLEADLGIDTVKQVEIFGKITANFDLETPEDLQLRDLNTITRLAAYIDGKLKGGSPTPDAATRVSGSREEAAGSAGEGSGAADHPVKRLVVEAVRVKAPAAGVNIFADKLFLVTADDFGFADGVIDGIKVNHGKAIPVFQDGSPRAGASGTVDFNDPDAAADAVERLARQHGRIDGLIHLAPLNGYFNGGAVDDRAVNIAVKSLFTMVKALSGGPCTLVSTICFDSVVFPYLPGGGDIHSPFAGMAGLMKTVNKELPDALVKAVDVSHPAPREAVEEIVALYLTELMSGDARVETGFRQKEKFVLSLEESPAENGSSFIKKNAAVVVTGGARGVTFEILKSLAREYTPRLVILGRSDVGRLTPRLESADGAEMMALLKEEMPGAKPVEIKKAADRMINLKKTSANLETLRRMGVRVDYHAVDVTDAEAVKRALDGLDAIDGVIHAAGVEESQFIEKKTMDSFNRVFDVKIRGALNLLAALENRDIDFFCAFSSVTARFGNEGQLDYTSANDMLGKMLQREKRKHPDRVYKAFAWTAWEGAGMAENETVKKVLRSRGLEFLPLDRGVRYFMDELRDARCEEVVFSGIDHDFDPDGLFAPAPPAAAPFIDSVVEKAPGMVRHARVLDLKRDLFLMDHCREEIPIFLGATGIETMAEAAATLAAPGARPVELTDFSIPYGIKILKGRPKEIHAVAKRIDENHFQCDIVSQFKNKKGVVMGTPTHHYTGRFRFSNRLPDAVRVKLPDFYPVECDGDLQDLLYHPARLFMDGLFRTVEEILSFDGETLVTRIRNSSEKPFFADDPAPEFLTDVAVVDAMFQTGGMLEVMSGSDIVLPKAISRARFLGPIQKNVDYTCLTQKSASREETNTYDLKLVDMDGILLLEIDGFEMVKVDKLGAENRIDDRLVVTKYRNAA